MQIDTDTLRALAAFDALKDLFQKHAKEVTRPALLTPKYSIMRLRDAHHAWLQDVSRVEKHEPNLSEGMDHLKQCAHLAYWLRRQSPIVDYDDWAVIQDDQDLYPDEVEKREFLASYGAEFIAFDFGFQICLYHEMDRLKDALVTPPALSLDYLRDVCHMLKFKHVSPHALYLIYRSLFVGR